MTATTPRRTGRGWLIAALTTSVAVLLGSVFAAVAWGGTWGPGAATPAPDLPGTVVHVALTSMGGPMMGGRTTMHGGVMSLSADRTTVSHGTVSFLVTNDGRIDHELVVLPLADGQAAGNRNIGDDNKVDESDSLGEASNTDGEGTGEGIRPGTSGWVTLTLAPGHYELVCNLAGHYAAGMYTELTVT